MTAPTSEEEKKKAAQNAPAPAQQPAQPAAKPANPWGNPSAVAGLAKPAQPKAADPAADKAKEDAAKEAAKQAGLVASDGSSIGRKAPSQFGGDEKKAIEDALAAYDAGKQPTLTHPNGMKWGLPFGNKQGKLPAGTYREYYVQKANNSSTYHGNRRLVIDVNTKRVYYTSTHYGDNGSPAFVLLRAPQTEGPAK